MTLSIQSVNLLSKNSYSTNANKQYCPSKSKVSFGEEECSIKRTNLPFYYILGSIGTLLALGSAVLLGNNILGINHDLPGAISKSAQTAEGIGTAMGTIIALCSRSIIKTTKEMRARAAKYGMKCCR